MYKEIFDFWDIVIYILFYIINMLLKLLMWYEKSRFKIFVFYYDYFFLFVFDRYIIVKKLFDFW